MFDTPITRLRTAGLIESLSSLALFFIAMPLKYLAGYPMAVTVVGSIHGGLFILYLMVLALTLRAPGLTRPLTALALLASIFPFPFGYLVLDPRLKAYEQALAPEPVPAD